MSGRDEVERGVCEWRGERWREVEWERREMEGGRMGEEGDGSR